MAERTTARGGAPVFIVDGSRTPFFKAKGKPGPFAAADLAIASARPLLARQPFEPTDFDEVILGCVMPGPDEANIARVAALRLGCGEQTPAWTVQRNCASGLQALDCAFRNISMGISNLVLAGGVESMSHAPVLLNDAMVTWLAAWSRARSFGARMKTLAQLRLHYFAPIIGLLRGLTDPVVGLNMGQTAENLAWRFQLSRQEIDAFALQSQQRLAYAQDNGRLREIEPMFDTQGKIYDFDDGVRRDSDMQKLAKLKPVFDRNVGKITAANSAQVTDGGAWLILASEQAVKDYQLPVLGRVVDTQWAGVDPAQMGLGPANAMAPLLTRHHLSINDIDYWEVNEAFAAQVLACLRAWQDDDYCKNELGLDSALGEIDQAKLNVDGGGISIGHPVGASGARIVLHLLHVLKRENARRGIASLCIGGGQGGAMMVERDESSTAAQQPEQTEQVQSQEQEA